MSLVDAMMVPCVIMDKTSVPDDEGGATQNWVEGAQIQASIVLLNSSLTQIAEALVQAKTYTITTKTNVTLERGDVIKRLSDGATFRVTSDSADRTAPTISSLDIAQVNAERWNLA